MKPKIFDLQDIKYAIEDGNVGFCIGCGEQQEGVEPDARKYECENCGESQVYGAEEILMEGWVK